MTVRIGLDVGGTFTDIVMIDPRNGLKASKKVRSTPTDPSDAILNGVKSMLDEYGIQSNEVVFFGHGTTVVTNMIVERKGAKIALLTTSGFRDVLELARQSRPSVYDYSVSRPKPIVDRRNRFEIPERVSSVGEVLVNPNKAQRDKIVSTLRQQEFEAVAVCFINSYRNPSNEKCVSDFLRAVMPNAYVSSSCEVAPEFREYERFSTTALNAFVGPHSRKYFMNLSKFLTDMDIPARTYTVTSNAGLISVDDACSMPIRTSLSGPAAGVAGIGKMLGDTQNDGIITFDVGGTSTDISLVGATGPNKVKSRFVSGLPVLAPMIDIDVIGAGGGSLAQVDPGGALKVGPESAGADPGPVAYGLGGQIPTVTDAALVLGLLDYNQRFGRSITLDMKEANSAIKEQIATPLRLTVEEASEGILTIACSNMSRAIRSFAAARGHDPKLMTLVAYGGAGPLLATRVAKSLRMSRVIIPFEPGTLCARALLAIDVARDFSTTRITPLDKSNWHAITDIVASMQNDGSAWLEKEGFVDESQIFEIILECRYQGQNFEIPIPINIKEGPQKARSEFDKAHKREQGFILPEQNVYVVTYRLRAIGVMSKRNSTENNRSLATGSVQQSSQCRSVWYHGEWWKAEIKDRYAISELSGPAILNEETSTTFIPPGWNASSFDDGSLLVREV